MGRVDQASLRDRSLELPQVRRADEDLSTIALAEVDHRLHPGKAGSRGGKDSPPLCLMERGIRSRTAAGSWEYGRLRQWEGDQNRGARSSIDKTVRTTRNAPLCLQKVGIPVRIHFWKPPRAIHGEGLNGLWNQG